MLRRIGNLFRRDRLRREVDEELADHLACAAEAGRDSQEARRALGSPLRHREASMDVRVAVWLDAVRADGVFAWRQLRRRPGVTAAAVLSMALAIGATTSAFRLVDAVLLQPLPVAAPGIGLAGQRWIASLLYGVRGQDAAMLAVPDAAIGITAIVAAAPPVLAALRTDPARALRAD